MAPAVDAIVVGSGPNGLVAAVELAAAGRSVRVLERAPTIGGGARTGELTLPGYRHDLCSAVHPLAVASPALRAIGLEREGLELLPPKIEAAHPLDDGSAVAVWRSTARTAAALGVDEQAYRALIEPFSRDWPALAQLVLGPVGRMPRTPMLALRFAGAGLRSARGLADSRFRGERARALLGGMAAHSMRSLDEPGTAAFALVLLSLAHGVGWPVARGGSQAISDALAARLRSLGGTVETGVEVSSMRSLPATRAVLFDVSPRSLAMICADQLPHSYLAQIRRFRYGSGAFKVDYALSGPVPWLAPECREAGTVHLGGSIEEVAASEAAVARGTCAPRPYVLVAQQSLVDPERAPPGKYTLWAYCHVPARSTADMTAAIESQIERFAPGFRELVLARATRGPTTIEAENPNYVGGDINCGAATLRQMLIRPALRRNPYTTPNPRVFLCSSATPPGGGVHGMCGHGAAHAALAGALR